MRICKFLLMLAVLGFNFSCSSKNDNHDPIKVICELADEVRKSEDSWEQEQWDAAAQQLDKALSELPSPLERREEMDLSSALSTLSMCSGDHARKAAKMITILENYEKSKNESSFSKEDEESSEDVVVDDDFKPYSSTDLPREVNLVGTIDNKYQVTMHLVRQGEDGVNGNYYYNKKGAANKLQLNGSYVDGDIELTEYNSDMQQSGHFEGKYTDGRFSGTFNTPGGQPMPFSLSMVSSGGSRSYSSSYTEDSDDDDYDNGRRSRSAVNSSSIDEEIPEYLNSNEEININIDEWLDGYEKILDRALKYADGYLKGDPAAIEQYNKILHESLYYSKTGGQVGRYFVRSGNPVQRNKYNRILEKANQLAEISMKR